MVVYHVVVACMVLRVVAARAPPLPPPLTPPLQPMLSISWKLLPPFPGGAEDNDGGFVDADTLVTAFGLSKASYPGCINTSYAINVSQPNARWQTLPTAPGFPRQEEAASRMPDGSIVYTGGFNNAWKAQGAPQRTYADAYRLFRTSGDGFQWERLPVGLPFPVNGHGLASIGSKLYLSGGNFDENEDLQTYGSMLHVLDTSNLTAGWRRLPDCPGTPRVGHSLTPVQGKLFVLGGDARSGPAEDCWKFDPVLRVWTRLPDIPLPNPAKTNGDAAFMDRFIVLVGGAANFNTTTVPNNTKGPYPHRPSFIPNGVIDGKPAECGVTASSNPNTPGITYWGYNNGVLVFDAQLNKWGTINATSVDSELIGQDGQCGPFPSNVCLPQVSVHGDKIAVVGGEADERLLHGIKYAHDSNLALIGTMSPVF